MGHVLTPQSHASIMADLSDISHLNSLDRPLSGIKSSNRNYIIALASGLLAFILLLCFYIWMPPSFIMTDEASPRVDYWKAVGYAAVITLVPTLLVMLMIYGTDKD